MNEKLKDRIISVAYGDASFLEKYRIKRLASKDKAVKNILDEYNKIAKAVHSISKEEFSGKPKIKMISDLHKSILEEIYLIIIGKPAISFLAGVLLVFAISFSLLNNKKLNYEGYTIAEVQQANIEAKQAFQIVNSIFSKTENKIKYDILTEEVSKPIKEGMSTVNKLFKKEKENEI
ncbi:MAG: hypothetical protein KKF62_15775 [Bacteroidetes bacterium]|nr:hypothetical protein [Bacteroidota bacterium]MBU1116783.1 hypothetical protein [Bacteroidota bacterium]MBU1798378.1 hypothetical protein [Bacteroidota bacterium]